MSSQVLPITIINGGGKSHTRSLPLSAIRRYLPKEIQLTQRDINLLKNLTFKGMDPAKMQDDVFHYAMIAALFMRVISDKIIYLLCRQAGIEPKGLKVEYVGSGSRRNVDRIIVVDGKDYDFAVSMNRPARILSRHSWGEMDILEKYHNSTYVIPKPYALSALADPPLTVLYREYLEGVSLEAMLKESRVDKAKLAEALGDMFADFYLATGCLPGDRKHDHTIVKETDQGYRVRICDIAFIDRADDLGQMMIEMWRFLGSSLQPEMKSFWAGFRKRLGEPGFQPFLQAAEQNSIADLLHIR